MNFTFGVFLEVSHLYMGSCIQTGSGTNMIHVGECTQSCDGISMVHWRGGKIAGIVGLNLLSIVGHFSRHILEG